MWEHALGKTHRVVSDQGKALKYLQALSGLTQEQFADLLNVCPVSYWKYTTGRIIPDESLFAPLIVAGVNKEFFRDNHMEMLQPGVTIPMFVDNCSKAYAQATATASHN